MRVVVTGSSGRIGRYVVQEFVDAGHHVLGADIAPLSSAPARALRVDLTDAGETYQALASHKAEAVVHLGAWPDAGIVPASRTYGDNVRGAYNLFQACADLGIRRVVYASSAQVYGFAGAPPLYAPVDEAHPMRPVNPYALAKCAAEQAAEYFIANYGLNILSFRFMGVRTPGQIAGEIEQMRRDPKSGGWLLWTRTDARDAAAACRLAVEAKDPAPGPYNITGAAVVLNQTAETLIRQHFGAATEVRSGLEGAKSPLSCARAEREFGYRPRYVWNEQSQHPEA
jgi:nucleoside-diphosphate-sugar epimerase